MLQSIYIQNYALIDKLDINFTSGFRLLQVKQEPENLSFWELSDYYWDSVLM